MLESKNILGVVLAGGRSSRMGQNKALMEFQGRPMIEHMIEILQKTGIKEVKISGEVEGYDCEVDKEAFEGPVKAIEGVIQAFPDCDGYLFVPVDMPFLSADVLQPLVQMGKSSYYREWPLPAFVKPILLGQGAYSVKDFMQQQDAEILSILKEYKSNFININTPEEWDEAVRS